MKQHFKKLKSLSKSIELCKKKLEQLEKEYEKTERYIDNKKIKPIYMIAKNRSSIIKITGYCLYEEEEGRSYDSINYWDFDEDLLFERNACWFLSSIERDYEEKPKKECEKLFLNHIKEQETSKLMFLNKKYNSAKGYLKEM